MKTGYVYESWAWRLLLLLIHFTTSFVQSVSVNAPESHSEPGIKLKYFVVKAIVAVFVTAIGLTLVIILIKCVAKNNKHDAKPFGNKQITTWSCLYRFSKDEIQKAIRGGGEKKFLGRGSVGHLFKGVLPGGQVVFIKQILMNNESGSFQSEVDCLSRIRYRNIVCLLGLCMENGEQYLVYEYCSAGNLAQHLLRKDTVLTWERRVKILRGCAFALRCLHRHIDGCIIHRDIKAMTLLTNILLTENFEPKLSGFGFAKMLNMEESEVFTEVRGTIGYMDPEYMNTAMLTCAADIYSFGVVALQLLCGIEVAELDLVASDQLIKKAMDVAMGKCPLVEFEDPRLNGNVNSVAFETIMQIAVLCVAKSSNGRPTMDIVFKEMDKAWKNTAAEMRARREMSSSVTPRPRSSEVHPV